jgi:hypothetical protein
MSLRCKLSIEECEVHRSMQLCVMTELLVVVYSHSDVHRGVFLMWQTAIYVLGTARMLFTYHLFRMFMVSESGLY